MNKLLVVEDEVITSELLRRYFQIVGYEVINALNGSDGVRLAIEEQPVVIILDIMLPDIDGFEVAKKLRADDRTKQIPIIFLTQKDDRRDKLSGLSIGVDDYVTKPFDVEELRLRVHNIIDRFGGTPLVDARTSLPNTALIKERLPNLLDAPDAVFLDAQIVGLGPYGEQYGPVAENQAIRTTAKMINDLLRQVDPSRSFIGHPSDDHFLIATTTAAAERLEKKLIEDFNERVANFYDTADQERGKMKFGEGDSAKMLDFMSLKLRRVGADALRALIKRTEDAARAANEAQSTPREAEEKQD
ncbi:MAG: response regulator transcription factor [Chloroflexi bacterium]|nr:response regulator transcription factor [Chloroflexota bacterium]